MEAPGIRRYRWIQFRGIGFTSMRPDGAAAPLAGDRVGWLGHSVAVPQQSGWGTATLCPSHPVVISHPLEVFAPSCSQHGSARVPRVMYCGAGFPCATVSSRMPESSRALGFPRDRAAHCGGMRAKQCMVLGGPVRLRTALQTPVADQCRSCTRRVAETWAPKLHVRSAAPARNKRNQSGAQILIHQESARLRLRSRSKPQAQRRP